MKALVKYEEARRALAEARTLPEIKSFRDKAEAMRAYAKQAGDRETAFWAAELKLRAERKGGEMLTEMAVSGERAGPGDNQWSSQDGSTLEDFEITYNQASRWQTEATLQETDFIVFKNCRFNEESSHFWVGCREFVRTCFRLIVLPLVHK